MAQAIETKYIGPTNTMGSRVKASFMDPPPSGNPSATIHWDYEFEPEENHRRAVDKLLKKTGVGEQLGLRRWKHGGTKKGYVWVYV